MNSEKKLYRLQVRTNSPMAEFAHLRVYDGHQEIIASEYESLDLKLQKGIYLVEMELNNNTISEYVRLVEDTTKILQSGDSYSSILASGYGSSHEYYTENAMRWSKETTSSDSVGDSALFLFFRYPNEAIAQESAGDSSNSMAADFLLLNSDRHQVFNFSPNQIKEDPKYGWLAFHANLPKGQYYLVYNGGDGREIPIFLFEAWQSQVFMTFRETPLFRTFKISIVHKEWGFQPENKYNYTLDALIQKLNNGIYYLPDDLLNEIAYGKWENPMLAILGAYTYLNSGRSDKDNLFSIILENLENRILNIGSTPDIIALKVLFAQHTNEKVPELKCGAPCMVSTGFNALIGASYDGIDIIEEGSYAEDLVTQQYNDLIWTSYVPLPYAKTRGIKRGRSAKRNGRSGISKSQSFDISISDVLIDKLNTEVLSSKKGLMDRDRLMDPIRISQDLNITPKVLNDVVKSIVETSTVKRRIQRGTQERKSAISGQNLNVNEETREILDKLLRK